MIITIDNYSVCITKIGEYNPGGQYEPPAWTPNEYTVYHINTGIEIDDCLYTKELDEMINEELRRETWNV